MGVAITCMLNAGSREFIIVAYSVDVFKSVIRGGQNEYTVLYITSTLH